MFSKPHRSSIAREKAELAIQRWTELNQYHPSCEPLGVRYVEARDGSGKVVLPLVDDTVPGVTTVSFKLNYN